MSDHLSREQLKRNELGEAVEASIHYAEGHLRFILTTVGALAAVALVGWGVFAWTASRRSSANDLLTRALKVSGAQIDAAARPDDPVSPTFASEAARDARAKELFTQLDGQYGSTSVGRVGKLYLAEAARGAGDRATARALWEKYLDQDATSTLAATVRVNLFQLDREEGRSAALVDSLKKMLEDPAKALPADLLLYQLALTYEQLGQSADARAAYRRIVDEHPQSPYLQAAQQQAGAPAGG